MNRTTTNNDQQQPYSKFRIEIKGTSSKIKKKKKKREAEDPYSATFKEIYSPKIQLQKVVTNQKSTNINNIRIPKFTPIKTDLHFNIQTPKYQIQSFEQGSPFQRRTQPLSPAKNFTMNHQKSFVSTPKFNRKSFNQKQVQIEIDESSQTPSYIKIVDHHTSNNLSYDQLKNAPPTTFKDWRKVQMQKTTERLAMMQPNAALDKERKIKLKQMPSKLRAEAIVNNDSKQKIIVEDNLESGLRMKLARLRSINVAEEPFTYSLKKVHDRSFIHKILPCIQKQQFKHSPACASNSKSPNLLRNTFSVEMYSEFLKYKYEVKAQKQKQQQAASAADNQTTTEEEQKIKVQEDPNNYDDTAQNPFFTNKSHHNESFKFPNVKGTFDIKAKLHQHQTLEKQKMSTRSVSMDASNATLQTLVGLSFREKMTKMMEIRKDQEERKKLMEQLKKKKAQGVSFDANFFNALEQKDMDIHLIDIITFEINKLFVKEMAKYRGVTSEFNAMLKRKNLLEGKLFKKRYEKIQKYLNGNPNLEQSLNPFKKAYQPSIFNDKMHDSKMEIPHNKELFENVIKEAFGDTVEEKAKKKDVINGEESSDESEEDVKNMTDQQIIEKIKHKFRKRVMQSGPSVMIQEYGKTKFLEQMMSLCNYQKLSRKLDGGRMKYERTNRMNKSTTQPVSPTPEEADQNQTKSSSFFITQLAMVPIASASLNVSPRPYNLASIQENARKNSRISNYLNFLTSSQMSSTQRLTDVSQISLPTVKHRLHSRFSSIPPSSTFKTNKIMSQTNYSKNMMKGHDNNKSNPIIHIIDEVNKEIQVKEDIKEKAKSNTLSKDDWSQIGQSRVLQFTILDRIIEDCMDYQAVERDKQARSFLGIKSPIRNLKKQTQSANERSKADLKEKEKKKNMEDTFTFLERLKHHNKLNLRDMSISLLQVNAAKQVNKRHSFPIKSKAKDTYKSNLTDQESNYSNQWPQKVIVELNTLQNEDQNDQISHDYQQRGRMKVFRDERFMRKLTKSLSRSNERESAAKGATSTTIVKAENCEELVSNTIKFSKRATEQKTTTNNQSTTNKNYLKQNGLEQGLLLRYQNQSPIKQCSSALESLRKYINCPSSEKKGTISTSQNQESFSPYTNRGEQTIAQNSKISDLATMWQCMKQEHESRSRSRDQSLEDNSLIKSQLRHFDRNMALQKSGCAPVVSSFINCKNQKQQQKEILINIVDDMDEEEMQRQQLNYLEQQDLLIEDEENEELVKSVQPPQTFNFIRATRDKEIMKNSLTLLKSRQSSKASEKQEKNCFQATPEPQSMFKKFQKKSDYGINKQFIEKKRKSLQIQSQSTQASSPKRKFLDIIDSKLQTLQKSFGHTDQRMSGTSSFIQNQTIQLNSLNLPKSEQSNFKPIPQMSPQIQQKTFDLRKSINQIQIGEPQNSSDELSFDEAQCGPDRLSLMISSIKMKMQSMKEVEVKPTPSKRQQIIHNRRSMIESDYSNNNIINLNSSCERIVKQNQSAQKLTKKQEIYSTINKKSATKQETLSRLNFNNTNKTKKSTTTSMFDQEGNKIKPNNQPFTKTTTAHHRVYTTGGTYSCTSSSGNTTISSRRNSKQSSQTQQIVGNSLHHLKVTNRGEEISQLIEKTKLTILKLTQKQ